MLKSSFVDWVDAEHSDTTQNALARLWLVHGQCNSARIDERVENAKLLKELSDENKKLEKKYSNCVAEVNKFIDDSCRKVRTENYTKIMNEGKEKEQMDLAMQLMEKQLKNQTVHRLRAVIKSRIEIATFSNQNG